MYNYGVCLARMGCYMDLGGDGIKQASSYFQQAAWVFNELMAFVSQIPPGETSLDFAKETLQMNSDLCLAQAQYLFFRKGSDAGLPAEKLAEVSAQVSVYFQKAFDNNQVNQGLRQYDQGKFANILGYHAKYFNALGYWELAKAKHEQAKKAAKGMGVAVAYCQMAV